MSADLYCVVCKMQCFTEELFNIHTKGRKHKTRVAKIEETGTGFNPDLKIKKARTGAWSKPPKELYCTDCKIQCFTPEFFLTHIEGLKHKTVVETGVAYDKLPAAGDVYCKYCDKTYHSQLYFDAHLEGLKHQAAFEDFAL